MNPGNQSESFKCAVCGKKFRYKKWAGLYEENKQFQSSRDMGVMRDKFPETNLNVISKRTFDKLFSVLLRLFMIQLYVQYVF